VTIERSTGIPVRVGMVAYGFAGGGYAGVTAELDQVVVQAAGALAAAYRADVEIRFNSDRESGGAWLRTTDGKNAELGICAGLVTAATRRGWELRARQYEAEAAGAGPLSTEQRQAARDLAAEWRGALADCPEGRVTILAHIRGQAVTEELRTELHDLPGWNDSAGGYHHGAAGSVDDALARCLRFVPSRLLPPVAESVNPARLGAPGPAAQPPLPQADVETGPGLEI
jgi:hypothetical protein